MIIIPEIKTVVILVPRTGTSSITEAVKYKYPKAIFLYRHMEADGIPFGYDRWRKIGMFRDPIDRLWSLYKYLKHFKHGNAGYTEKLRKSVDTAFEDWLLNNQVPFSDPYDSNNGDYWPFYSVKHIRPENFKSQFVQLRPDLGTEIFYYSLETSFQRFFKLLDLQIPFSNASTRQLLSNFSEKAQDHMRKFHSWDLLKAREWHPQNKAMLNDYRSSLSFDQSWYLGD